MLEQKSNGWLQALSSVPTNFSGVFFPRLGFCGVKRDLNITILSNFSYETRCVCETLMPPQRPFVTLIFDFDLD